jgi:hypothetical protein
MYFWASIFFSASIAIASFHCGVPSQNDYRFPNAQLPAIQESPATYDHWNQAQLSEDQQNQKCNTNSTTLLSRLNAINEWHPRKIDYLEFVNIKILQQDRLKIVTHPDFELPVLIKIVNSLLEMPSLKQESTIYRLLHGTGATPEFLGHVTEDGQVIGFITEYIEEVRSIRDRNVQGCLNTLRTLHDRGIAHGDAHDGNCLIRKDGTAALIDFELSLETWSNEEFARDLDIMSRCIQALPGSS